MTESVTMPSFANPYRPGAGHMPPYLAGRVHESLEFEKLLRQDTILENLVLTGLRGLGKTVLLETFRPKAQEAGWLWVGTDLSETASITEENLALRLLTDLSVVTSQVTVEVPSEPTLGFSTSAQTVSKPLDFDLLAERYATTPGLAMDKLKACLLYASAALKAAGSGKVVFAYDEAQNLSDHAKKDQFPLSVLLDVFQSIQRQDCHFMLALTGLPTLLAKLVDARTYSERMFRVVTLDRLNDEDSAEAVRRPVEKAGCPVSLTEESVTAIVRESSGYPYFLQFMCREIYDVFLQQIAAEGKAVGVPLDAIQRKLDTDFFAGRWAKATDRQRHLLYVIATLHRENNEFTIQEVVEQCKTVLSRPFSSSHVNQMLSSLAEQGLVYKNRFGKYSFAVPLLDTFIRRSYSLPNEEQVGVDLTGPRDTEHLS